MVIFKVKPQRQSTNQVMLRIRKSRIYMIRQMKNAVGFPSPPQSHQILQPAHGWPHSSSMATRIALTSGDFTSGQLATNQASSVALRRLGKCWRGSLFPPRGVTGGYPQHSPQLSTHSGGRGTMSRGGAPRGIRGVKDLCPH